MYSCTSLCYDMMLWVVLRDIHEDWRGQQGDGLLLVSCTNRQPTSLSFVYHSAYQSIFEQHFSAHRVWSRRLPGHFFIPQSLTQTIIACRISHPPPPSFFAQRFLAWFCLCFWMCCISIRCIQFIHIFNLILKSSLIHIWILFRSVDIQNLLYIIRFHYMTSKV